MANEATLQTPCFLAISYMGLKICCSNGVDPMLLIFFTSKVTSEGYVLDPQRGSLEFIIGGEYPTSVLPLQMGIVKL